MNVIHSFLSPQIVMAILVFIIPESPSWLLHKRLYERADEALAWLGMDQEQFVTEVEMDMQHRLEKVETKCDNCENQAQNLELWSGYDSVLPTLKVTITIKTHLKCP